MHTPEVYVIHPTVNDGKEFRLPDVQHLEEQGEFLTIAGSHGRFAIIMQTINTNMMQPSRIRVVGEARESVDSLWWFRGMYPSRGGTVVKLRQKASGSS